MVKDFSFKFEEKMQMKCGLVTGGFALLFALVAGAQSQSVSFNFGGGGTPSAEPAVSSSKTDAGSDTVKVLARGMGATREEALKDAYRDAIERAVGLYVDAEALVENDEVVRNQVLTASNAYIKECRELETTNGSGGMVQIRIMAVVQKQKLVAKLKGVMPTQNIAVSLDTTQFQSMAAERATKEKRAVDAKALLENLLKDLDPIPQMMVATIDQKAIRMYTQGKFQQGKQTLDKLPDGTIAVGALMAVHVDEKKYFEQFVPQVKAVLDQISISPPKEIRFNPIEPEVEDHEALVNYCERKDQVEGGGIAKSAPSRARWSRVANDGLGQVLNAHRLRYGSLCSLYGDGLIFGSGNPQRFPGSRFMGVGCYGKGAGSRYYCRRDFLSFKMLRDIKDGYERGPFQDVQTYNFTLLTSVNKTRTMWKGTMYWLDPETAFTLYKWILGKGAIQFGDPNDRTHVTYNVIFEDGNGDELHVYEWKVPRLWLMNIDVNDYRDDSHNTSTVAYEAPVSMSHVMRFYASPFVGGAAKSLIQWRDIPVKEEVLRQVKNIKIEFAH